MEKRIVTVSRQFGSGGRTVAQMISEKLGWKFYDRELVSKIAKASGLHEGYVAENGEYAGTTSSLLFSLAMGAGAIHGGGLSVADSLYIEQAKLIRSLADSEPCVIVGRCADYILREREDTLHVLLHADMSFRTERIKKHYVPRNDTPEKRLRDMDERRKTYYRHYTGRAWGLAENFDIALNTGTVGLE